MRQPITHQLIVLFVLIAAIWPALDAQSQRRRQQPAESAAAQAWARYIDARCDAILETLQKGDPLRETGHAIETLIDQVLFHAPDDADDAVLSVAELARIAQWYESGLNDESHRSLRQLLQEHEVFRRTLLFFVDHDADDLPGAISLLSRLHRERGETIVKYPELIAALIAVHDRPLRRRFNENSASAPDAVMLFDYFVRRERQLSFGLRIPPEWLVHVVDVTTSIDELEWAVGRYERDPLVGARFFDIEYDFDHLQKGSPKKSTVAGWNLPNILRFGGVCADQAYFAKSVGKAIGVPTAYCVGQADANHAWVGFVQQRGGVTAWNFTVGRYESYQRVRGVIQDPRTGARLSDAEIALRAEAIRTEPINRWRSVAYNDLAVRLWPLESDGVIRKPPEVDPSIASATSVEPHERRESRQLWLIEQSLRRYPANEFTWESFRRVAQLGRMDLDAKKRWTEIVDALCGTAYPDFSFSILAALVSSVDDASEQHRIWNRLFRNFQQRADIAAEIRMRQGKLWEREGDLLKAGQCYEDIIKRFPNTGYLIVHALNAAENILQKGNRQDLILALYQQAWGRMQAPENRSVYFTRGTPWWMVGHRFAELLSQHGQAQLAAEVQRIVSGQ